MNRSEIRTEVRNLLNEDTAGFWSDSKLNSYINLANQRVNSIISLTRQDYFNASATFSTVAEQKSYSFPTDCQFIRRMEIIDLSDQSSIVKLDELKWPRVEAGGDWIFTASAQPQRYTIRAKQFDLLPVPDAVYTLRLYYETRKSDLASDVDEPSSPADFHDMLVFWTCVLAKKQNEEDDAGYASLFNARKAELINMLTRRGSDDSIAVEAYLEGII